MGVDLLDINFRLQREFAVEIDMHGLTSELLKLIELAESEAVASGGRIERDITVQQLFSVVCNRIYHQHGSVPEDAWPRFAGIIVDVLLVRPEEVRPGAWLERDLGMS